MHVLVRVDGDEQETELRSLQGWLREEPVIRRTTTVSLVEQPPEPGAMGSWVDAVQLVTDNGWKAASFVLSVVTWRQTRPRAPRVTIRRGDIEVTLADGTDAEVQRVIALLEEEPPDGQGEHR